MLFEIYKLLKEYQEKILGKPRLTIFAEDGFLVLRCIWTEKEKHTMQFQIPFEELAQTEMDAPDILFFFVERCNTDYRHEVLKAHLERKNYEAEFLNPYPDRDPDPRPRNAGVRSDHSPDQDRSHVQE